MVAEDPEVARLADRLGGNVGRFIRIGETLDLFSAQALVERMAKTGVLAEVAPNGTRPVLIRAEDLAAARS